MQLFVVFPIALLLLASSTRAQCPYAASAGAGAGAAASVSSWGRAPLSESYYKTTCPSFEKIVKNYVVNDMQHEAQMPAHLLRLLWHDCAVSGCDASVLLKSIEGIPSEREADDNVLFGLMKGGYDTINRIKAALEAKCPRTVSCADIITAAAKHALIQAHGPIVPMRYGRRDGPTSLKDEPNLVLPHQDYTPNQALRVFERLGLSTVDMVALLGTHTIGTANCWKFYNRLGNKFDKRFAPEYAEWLNKTCIPPSPGSDGFWAWLPLDNVTSTRFDNQYFKNVQNGYGLLNTDAGLLSRADTRKVVGTFAKSQAAFFAQYRQTLMKLSELNVLTAPQGEVRINCEVVLPNA